MNEEVMNKCKNCKGWITIGSNSLRIGRCENVINDSEMFENRNQIYSSAPVFTGENFYCNNFKSK